MTVSRLAFDIFSAVLLLLTALGGAWMPRYLSKRAGGVEVVAGSASSVAFHLGNMLSGGVMLSAGFCHLLADALRHLSFIGRFPITPFLAALGYIITLTADQVVQAVTESSSASSGDDGSNPAPHWGSYVAVHEATHASPPVSHGGCCDHDPEAPPLLPRNHKDSAGMVSNRSSKQAGQRDSHSGSPRSNGGMQTVALLAGSNINSSSACGNGGSCGAHAANGGLHTVVEEGPSSPESVHVLEDGADGTIASPRTVVHPHHLELESGGCNHHAQLQLFLGQKQLPFATAVLLALALCIHSMLEGIALGAQTSMRDTENIMIAILAHKGLAAYALGASIVESKASASKFWTVIGLFASATPLGILVGYATSNMGHGAVAAAMSALASGTFLYVALNEVIPKELEVPNYRVAKMGALLLGFGLMSLLAVWA